MLAAEVIALETQVSDLTNDLSITQEQVSAALDLLHLALRRLEHQADSVHRILNTAQANGD